MTCSTRSSMWCAPDVPGGRCQRIFRRGRLCTGTPCAGNKDRVAEQILPIVREQLRAAEGRNPEPSAGLIESHSVKGADTVGRESRGYDVGKKINGRKRFIVTDTLGLLLTVMVCTAGRQDRDGAKTALLWTYLATPVRFAFADGAFAGRLLDWAQAFLRTTIEVLRKPASQRGFAVIPRRWAVERSWKSVV